MEDCIFCKIVTKEASADILKETDNLVIFKDIKPSAPVHLLIVPKKHVVSIKELAPEDRDLIADMIYIGKDVAAEQGLEGYRLSYNVGRVGGQLVDHLHLHLLGGWANSKE